MNRIIRTRPKIFYGWVIVAISLVTMTAAYGVYFSWPIFYVAILDEFGWSRAGTALIFSIAAMLYGFGSPISGILFDKFGPKRLFAIAAVLIAIGAAGCSQSNEIWQFSIFYGFFMGFGAISAGYVPNSALVSKWFDKKRSTALGISQIGTRDSFLLAPLVQVSILSLGWRNSYLLLAAAVAIIIIPLAQFLRTRPQDMGLLPDGLSSVEDKERTEKGYTDERIVNSEWASTEWTLRKVLKKCRFWAIVIVNVGGGLVIAALINHLVALTTDMGFTAIFAATLLSIYAVTAIIGRSCGFISDLIGREITYTLSMSMMLFALTMLLLIKDASMPAVMYIFAACYGFGSGLHTPVLVAAAGDLFQGRQFGSIIGSANIGYGMGVSIGTWLYGYIFDISGAYTPAVIITMCAVGTMCIAMWVAAPRSILRISRRAKKAPSHMH
jgi:MFS family permease